MNQEKVGKLIAKKRKELNLTQEELAEKFGIGASSVSKWERGLTTPDISILKSLADTLCVSVEDLIDGPKDEVEEVSENTNNDIEVALSNEIKEVKVNKDNNKRKRIIVTISITLVVILALGLFLLMKKSGNIYNLKSKSEDFSVNGYVVNNKESSIITISLISLQNKEMDIMIDSIAVNLIYNNKFITASSLDDKTNLSDSLKNIYINYVFGNELNLSKDDFYLIINFVDLNNNESELKIPLKLEKK